MTYGQCENADVVYHDQLLPIGLAEGAVLLRDLPKDTCLSLADVRLPEGRLVDRLRDEQNQRFFNSKA